MLLKELKKIYDKIILDNNKLQELERIFYENNFRSKSPYYPLVKYIIKNYTVEYEIKNLNSETIDARITDIHLMIQNALEYAKTNNIIVNNTILHIWILDRYPYDVVDLDITFPIYVFAKPKNTNYLIIPDNTFMCLSLYKKYQKCHSFDIIKKKIKSKCNDIKFKNKLPIIYFKGTPTTKTNSKLRETLEKYSNDKEWIDIKLDGWDNYQPIYEFCKYKYLLNLPGHWQWSNRFKYLFLMKSLVININVSYVGKDYKDEPYITFIDYFVKPDEDYINIDATYNHIKRNEHDSKNDETNKMVIDKLADIYQWSENNPKKTRKIVKSGYKKIKNLKNESIYQYVINAINLNSQMIQI